MSRDLVCVFRVYVSCDACVFVQRHLRHPRWFAGIRQISTALPLPPPPPPVPALAAVNVLLKFRDGTASDRGRAVCYATSAPTPAFV